jgi:glycosyltransferase A (GT-A) superfamily protein (DUF2064 family)
VARPTLILFARAPAIGVGKSRLARDVGRVEAWRLYRGFLADLLRRLEDPRWRLVVRLAPDRGRLVGRRCEPQGRGDLGRRLERALRRHGRGPVAVVGADSPELTRAHVAAAFEGARRRGAALGPAEDGGFWILALSPARVRRLDLEGVRWSTDQAFADAWKALGGKAERLGLMADIDDGAALSAYRSRTRCRPRR